MVYQLQEAKQLREEGWPLRQVILLEDEHQDIGQLVLNSCAKRKQERKNGEYLSISHTATR
jgi:hypothetical protein